MSQFYGTLESDRGVSTRAGHKYVVTSAQSWEGSVSVRLVVVKPDVEVSICVGEGSTSHPERCIWRGKLKDLLKIDSLIGA